MNPFSVDLKSLIVDASEGTDPASSSSGQWPVHIPHLPMGAPDDCIAVIDSGGPAPLYLMCPTEIDDARCQISLRSSSYLTGYAKLMTIRTKVTKLGFVTLGSALYWRITSASNILYLEKDEHQRFVFVLNVLGRRS